MSNAMQDKNIKNEKRKGQVMIPKIVCAVRENLHPRGYDLMQGISLVSTSLHLVLYQTRPPPFSNASFT